jgi:hypothetical protein
MSRRARGKHLQRSDDLPHHTNIRGGLAIQNRPPINRHSPNQVYAASLFKMTGIGWRLLPWLARLRNH